MKQRRERSLVWCLRPCLVLALLGMLLLPPPAAAAQLEPVTLVPWSPVQFRSDSGLVHVAVASAEPHAVQVSFRPDGGTSFGVRDPGGDAAFTVDRSRDAGYTIRVESNGLAKVALVESAGYVERAGVNVRVPCQAHAQAVVWSPGQAGRVRVEAPKAAATVDLYRGNLAAQVVHADGGQTRVAGAVTQDERYWVAVAPCTDMGAVVLGFHEGGFQADDGTFWFALIVLPVLLLGWFLYRQEVQGRRRRPPRRDEMD